MKINSILNDSIWKLGYTDFSFWDSTISHSRVGYIDTFSILENKFRIIHDTSFNAFIETYKNKNWVKNLNFVSLGNHNNYDRTKDINLDGFNDITYTMKWDTEIFLFNPKAKIFIDSSFNLPEEWLIIDKNKKILCSFWSHYYVFENKSNLYTFKNNQIVNLYYLEYIGSKEDNTIQKVILYKSKNSKESIKIKEIQVDSDEFDYFKFWKSNYKKLLRLH